MSELTVGHNLQDILAMINRNQLPGALSLPDLADEISDMARHDSRIAADLGENTVIVIEPHNDDLPEHAAVNVAKSFKRRAQLQLFRRLKFDTRHHAHAADFADHFIARERIAEALAQNFSHDEGAFAQIFPFEYVERSEGRPWTSSSR